MWVWWVAGSSCGCKCPALGCPRSHSWAHWSTHFAPARLYSLQPLVCRRAQSHPRDCSSNSQRRRAWQPRRCTTLPARRSRPYCSSPVAGSSLNYHCRLNGGSNSLRCIYASLLSDCLPLLCQHFVYFPPFFYFYHAKEPQLWLLGHRRNTFLVTIRLPALWDDASLSQWPTYGPAGNRKHRALALSLVKRRNHWTAREGKK